MKTSIKFFNNDTKEISTCGDPLNIEISSRDLNWEGITLEKGSSPHFYPENIITPYFYFAMDMSNELSWQAEFKGKMNRIKTLPGEIWMNPPDIPFTHRIDTACHFIILAIEKDRLLSAFNEKLKAEDLQFLKSYNVNDNYLKSMIEMFYNETISKNPNGKVFINNLLQLFSTYFITNYSNHLDLTKKNVKSSKIDEKSIELIKNHILENIEENIAIEDMAIELNMSKFYFLKEFKKLMGITPYQYILQIKLEESKSLLKDKETKIVDIAYKLGFNDQSHFSNSFKKFFGITPGKYRE